MTTLADPPTAKAKVFTGGSATVFAKERLTIHAEGQQIIDSLPWEAATAEGR
jgi:hypothetical protein